MSRFFHHWSNYKMAEVMDKCPFSSYFPLLLKRVGPQIYRYFKYYRDFRFLFWYFFRTMLRSVSVNAIRRMETKTKLKRLTIREQKKWDDRKAYQRALLLTYLFVGYSRKRVVELMGFPSYEIFLVELGRAFSILKEEKSNLLGNYFISIFKDDIFINRGYNNL